MRNSSNRLLVLALLSGCALTTTMGATTSTRTAHGKLVMLDVTGKTPDAALTALQAAGFAPSFEVNRILLECEGGPTDVGRIRCQSPAPGDLIDPQAIINVTVNEGSHVFSTLLVRAQLEPMRGMTIADAKAYLTSLGHDGEVAIFEQPTFSSSCGTNRVCEVEPESGTGIHDRVTLVINPNSNVEISVPPP